MDTTNDQYPIGCSQSAAMDAKPSTLMKLPTELRLQIFSNLATQQLAPVRSRDLSIYHIVYTNTHNQLPVSRQFNAEMHQALHSLSNTHRSAIIIRLDLQAIRTLLDIMKMARGFDISWLRTHDPALEDKEVADWVIERPIGLYASILARHFGGLLPDERENMRCFLGKLLQRLRLWPTLDVRILLLSRSHVKQLKPELRAYYLRYVKAVRNLSETSKRGTDSAFGFRIIAIRPQNVQREDLSFVRLLNGKERVNWDEATDVEMQLYNDLGGVDIPCHYMWC